MKKLLFTPGPLSTSSTVKEAMLEDMGSRDYVFMNAIREIRDQLLELAHSLEAKRASLYRIQAYRRAAETILGLDRPVEDLVAVDGRKSLKRLPGIGPRLSLKIEKLVRTGEIAILKEDDRTCDRHDSVCSVRGPG